MCMAYTLKLLLNFIHLKSKADTVYLLTPCVGHILCPVKPVKVTFNKASSATTVPAVCSHLQTTQYEGIIITSLFCPQPCVFQISQDNCFVLRKMKLESLKKDLQFIAK